MRHVIEIAILAGVVEVDGRRSDLVAQGEHRQARFQSAGAAEQWPVIDLVELTHSL